MFRIDMLPANYGDCLWIEYGDPDRPTRILIDGGTGKTFGAIRARVDEVVRKERTCHFELFVITHVDQDHIGGALELVRHHEELKVSFDDIWFNGFKHVVQVREEQAQKDELGVKDAEQLTHMIREDRLHWNVEFGGDAIVVRDDAPLPSKQLHGGMRLTLLSPTPAALMKIGDKWADVVSEEELRAIEEEKTPSDELGDDVDINTLATSDFASDTAVANGTSIALLAEYDEKRLLLGADAFAPLLLASLQRYDSGRKPRIHAFKLPHHGSRANLSNELLAAIECKDFLVSTNGVKHRHPNLESIARAIRAGGSGTKLHFNYKTKFNDMWESRTLRADHEYETFYAKPGEASRVTLA